MTESLSNKAYYAARWKDVGLTCHSFEEFQREVEDYEINLRTSEQINSEDKFDRASNRLRTEIFPILLPALETTLVYACHNRLLIRNRTIFNGIDNIAEILWNQIEKENNEAHEWKNIFEMDWCREYLTDNPRPIYPLSCMIDKTEAATIIQSFYRGYLVRKMPRVQRFRKFWARVKDRLRRGIPPTPASSEASLMKRCINCYPQKNPKVLSKSVCSSESMRETKLADEKKTRKRSFLKKCHFKSEPAILEAVKTCTNNLKF